MALTPAKAAGLVVLTFVLRWAPVMAGPDDSAQQLFGHGVDAAQQNRWNDARVAFERAYELSQRPVVLINLAGAQAKTGRLRKPPPTIAASWKTIRRRLHPFERPLPTSSRRSRPAFR